MVIKVIRCLGIQNLTEFEVGQNEQNQIKLLEPRIKEDLDTKNNYKIVYIIFIA